MISTVFDQIVALAGEFRVPREDLVLIALNLHGIDGDPPLPRARVDVTLDTVADRIWKIIVPTNCSESPFKLRNGELTLEGPPVARVTRDVADDAVGGYFRRAGAAATVNPNARSRCVGCAFCPNTLEAASDPRATTYQTMRDLVGVLEQAHPDGHLRGLSEVTISTGCYGTEDAAVDAVLRLNEALRERGARPCIGLLSSVLVSETALRRVSAEVEGFVLRLTIECFDRRPLLLKQSKAALDLDAAVRIFEVARSLNIDISYTYIVGLDSTQSLSDGNEVLLPLATRWPNFQVYQSHNAIMASLRDSGAGGLRYYVEARASIEAIAKSRGLSISPSNWEGYRSLWYLSFAGSSIDD